MPGQNSGRSARIALPAAADKSRCRPDASRKKAVGDRGLVSISIRSALDHQAGFARELEKLMLDYFDDRLFFAAPSGFFMRRR